MKTYKTEEEPLLKEKDFCFTELDLLELDITEEETNKILSLGIGQTYIFRNVRLITRTT